MIEANDYADPATTLLANDATNALLGGNPPWPVVAELAEKARGVGRMQGLEWLTAVIKRRCPALVPEIRAAIEAQIEEEAKIWGPPT